MEVVKLKSLLMNVIIFNIIQNIFGKSICKGNNYCDDCNICNLKDDRSCGYKNLFCLKNDNQIFFFYYLQSSYVNYFNDYFNNEEIEYICDGQNINLTELNNEKVIRFGNEYKYKNYLTKNSIHCNYEIKNIFHKNYDVYLSITITNKYFYDTRNLRFEINLPLPNSTVINYNNYYYNDYYYPKSNKINLNNITSFSLMLDIDKIQIHDKDFNFNIKEELEIKIYTIRNYNYDDYNENKNVDDYPINIKKKSNNLTIIYSILTAVGLLAMIIIFIVCIRKYRKKIRIPIGQQEEINLNRQPRGINLNRQPIGNSLNRQPIRVNLNRQQRENIQNENQIIHFSNINQENENKRKKELLFNDKLYPIIYNKDLFKENNNNICSICLENYIDQKSLISLTPCNHIFHFECLKQWSMKNTGAFKCPNCNYDFMEKKN